MSLISEYLAKISIKEHPSENDVNIPPMLFDSNLKDLNKKKRVKKIIFSGIVFLLAVIVAGYFLLDRNPIEKKELVSVKKIVLKTEPIVSGPITPEVKQISKPEETSIAKQSSQTQLKESQTNTEPVEKSDLVKIDQLTINVGNDDEIGEPPPVDNINNDQTDKEFQKKPNRAGYKQYFNLGLTAQKNKDYYKAGKYYEKSLAINPDYKKSLLNLSSIYIKTGMYNKAVDLLEQLKELEPDNLKACINLGIVYLQQGFFKRAEELLKEAVGKDKNNILSLYNLAVLYQKTDQVDKALLIYEKIIKIDPDNSKSMLACSAIYEKKKEYEKAIESYKKCLTTTANQSNEFRQVIISRIKLIQAIMAKNK